MIEYYFKYSKYLFSIFAFIMLVVAINEHQLTFGVIDFSLSLICLSLPVWLTFGYGTKIYRDFGSSGLKDYPLAVSACILVGELFFVYSAIYSVSGLFITFLFGCVGFVFFYVTNLMLSIFAKTDK
ncbi:hypothetical protein DB48_01410 [Shewanella sp. cp20]|nr:hypothetical protein DB48_01410 [Shewanella sp. cp20]